VSVAFSLICLGFGLLFVAEGDSVAQGMALLVGAVAMLAATKPTFFPRGPRATGDLTLP
jgi:hypothetical protein